jgi:nitroimidazol reductase NimA-like FMN-containing flavoprotein (pyridoxamine 5'-phosphate oxidase superfamily)
MKTTWLTSPGTVTNMIELTTYPQIVDLNKKEIGQLLRRVHFGHLGLSKGRVPYVIPIHFAYRPEGIYFYTTEGLKTRIMDKNPVVCLQAEDIHDREHWESVIVTGRAERLTGEADLGRAMKVLKRLNERLIPAWSIRWTDDSIRSNIEAVYRISADTISGRKTLGPLLPRSVTKDR